MFTINIKNDYFGYLNTDDSKLFKLLLKSFTRIYSEYNVFFKSYKNVTKKYYTLVNKGKIIKVKAGFIQYLCKSLDDKNIKYILIDNRPKLKLINNIITNLNSEVKLRDYQIQAVRRAINNRFCCLQLPTGTGKTEISASIIKTIYNTEKGAFLYVVPTISLMKEAKKRFIDYGIEVNTEYPIKEDVVNILTYMSLVRANKDKLSNKQKDLVKYIIFDEVHHIGGEKNSKIVHMFRNLKLCVGMSATIVDSIDNKIYLKDFNNKELNIIGCTGSIVFSKSINESIDANFVTPIKIFYRDFIMKNKNYIKQDFGSDWIAIKNNILKSEDRATFVANYVKYIIDTFHFHTLALLIPEIEWSHLYMNNIKNTLVSYNTRLFELQGGGRIYEYINGNLKYLDTEEDKQDALDAICDTNTNTIFSATTFFFEGINIKNIQALLNCYGGKDFKRVKQQCGRAMRLFDNKDVAYIFEIRDLESNVLLSQFNKRMDIYIKDFDASVISI